MRAMFTCQNIEINQYTATAKLTAVTGGSEEKSDFCELTPAGELSIQIDKKAAYNYFKPGKDYYLDFTEVVEENKIPGPFRAPLGPRQVG